MFVTVGIERVHFKTKFFLLNLVFVIQSLYLVSLSFLGRSIQILRRMVKSEERERERAKRVKDHSFSTVPSTYGLKIKKYFFLQNPKIRFAQVLFCSAPLFFRTWPHIQTQVTIPLSFHHRHPQGMV